MDSVLVKSVSVEASSLALIFEIKSRSSLSSQNAMAVVDVVSAKE